MSSIGSVPAHISKLIQVAGERSRTENQIAYAVAGKQQQVMKQAGQAAVAMIEQVVDLQAQLAQGNLDVRA